MRNWPQKQLARAQLLYDKGAIAQAELEAAQDADAKAKVDLQTADRSTCMFWAAT